MEEFFVHRVYWTVKCATLPAGVFTPTLGVPTALLGADLVPADRAWV